MPTALSRWSLFDVRGIYPPWMGNIPSWFITNWRRARIQSANWGSVALDVGSRNVRPRPRPSTPEETHGLSAYTWRHGHHTTTPYTLFSSGRIINSLHLGQGNISCVAVRNVELWEFPWKVTQKERGIRFSCHSLYLVSNPKHPAIGIT